VAVLQLDPEAQGLFCVWRNLKRHSSRAHPKILKLLGDVVTDVNEPIGPDNLRQVIINALPSGCDASTDDSLLVAELKAVRRSRFKRVCFSCLPDTWRQLKAQNQKSECRV